MRAYQKVGLLAGFAILMSLTAAAFAADKYPLKPVSLVIAFPAGGGADVLARALGRELSDLWSQPVLIDNRPGAGTTIAAATVAKASPDGYVLYMANLPVHATAAALYKDLPYDTLKSFTPISLLAKGAPLILVVNPSSKADSVKAFVDLAKAKPTGLSYTSTGAGSAVHLTTEMFASQAGIQLLHVPYKGGSAAQLSVASGEVDAVFTDPSVVPLIKQGKLRALAVTSLTRWGQLPDVPSIAESGFPGFESIGTILLLGPANMHTDTVDSIRDTLKKAISSTTLQQRFGAIAYTLELSTPEALQTRIASDVDKFGAVIKALHLTAQ